MAGFFSALFWGLLILSLLVVIHEAGHFLFARLFRVRVTEFFLGMPFRYRLAVRSRKYGTLFGVTPLLLGGYNRICGMSGAEDERLARVLGYVTRRGRVEVQSMADDLGIEVEDAYELLSTLEDWASVEAFYDPELGEHENQADWPRSFQTPARDGACRTIYDLGYDAALPGSIQAGQAWDQPFDDDALLAEERSHTYLGCSFVKRLAVLVAGPCFNLLCAIAIVFSVLAFVGVDVVSTSSRIGSLVEGSLAQASGILPGDEIVRIGDTPVSTWDDLTEPIQRFLAEDEDFEVEVVRDGEHLIVPIRLEGSEDRAALGVYPVVEKYRVPPLEAFGYAVSYAGEVAMYVVRLIDPSHTIEVLDQSSSVVGIASAASQAAQNGPADLLMLVASVSMSLCFMNLLPIPPLDGGKILLEVIELIRRKPLSKGAQAIVSYIGLAFFLFVFIYVLRLDILRIFTG